MSRLDQGDRGVEDCCLVFLLAGQAVKASFEFYAQAVDADGRR